MIVTNPDKPRHLELLRIDTPESLFELSILYDFGIGVKQNFILSSKYLLQSAEIDHLPAILKIANHFINGDLNYSVDIEEATFWLNKATSLGSVEATEILETLKSSSPIAMPVNLSFKDKVVNIIYGDTIDPENVSEKNILDKLLFLKSAMSHDQGHIHLSTSNESPDSSIIEISTNTDHAYISVDADESYLLEMLASSDKLLTHCLSHFRSNHILSYIIENKLPIIINSTIYSQSDINKVMQGLPSASDDYKDIPISDKF